MIPKFTFKNEPLGKWETTETVNIKFNKKCVGTITRPAGQQWQIRIRTDASAKALKTNPNCLWMWSKIKREFMSLDIAKSWLNDNRNKVIPHLYIEKQEASA